MLQPLGKLSYEQRRCLHRSAYHQPGEFQAVHRPAQFVGCVLRMPPDVLDMVALHLGLRPYVIGPGGMMTAGHL